MDKMAYLQQIASDNKNNHKPSGSGFDILSYLTPRNILIAVISIFFLIGASLLFNTKKTIDTRDRDLLIRSYFMAKYLNDETISKYGDLLKSSDLRAYTASLKTVLSELMLTESKSLNEEFGIEDVSDLEEDTIAQDEKSKNKTLNSTLETAHLSAHLDRVLVREFTLQLTYLINYQTEAHERTTKPNAKTATDTEIKNLTNLKNNYATFNTKAV